MSDTCQTCYQTARKHAGFTQESAAGFLGISPRTLAAYEASLNPVPDDIAVRMVELYRAPELEYRHLQLNPVARLFLPPLDDKTLSQAALSLISAAKNYENKQNLMIEVCADGKVENAEAAQWAEVNEAIRGLVRAAFTLLYANKD